MPGIDLHVTPLMRSGLMLFCVLTIVKFSASIVDTPLTWEVLMILCALQWKLGSMRKMFSRVDSKRSKSSCCLNQLRCPSFV